MKVLNSYELLISNGDAILTAYTMKEDRPYLLLEGWGRSSYHLLQNNHFFYWGSGGAADTTLIEYQIDEAGELRVVECYFIEGYEDNNWYHNTTGSKNPKESECMGDDYDAFVSIITQYEADYVKLDLTYFDH